MEPYGRMNISPTLLHSRKAGFWVTKLSRHLTVAECMRLQGMQPETLAFGKQPGERQFQNICDDSSMFKLIGNSMCV